MWFQGLVGAQSSDIWQVLESMHPSCVCTHASCTEQFVSVYGHNPVLLQVGCIVYSQHSTLCERDMVHSSEQWLEHSQVSSNVCAQSPPLIHEKHVSVCSHWSSSLDCPPHSSTCVSQASTPLSSRIFVCEPPPVRSLTILRFSSSSLDLIFFIFLNN